MLYRTTGHFLRHNLEGTYGLYCQKHITIGATRRQFPGRGGCGGQWGGKSFIFVLGMLQIGWSFLRSNSFHSALTTLPMHAAVNAHRRGNSGHTSCPKKSDNWYDQNFLACAHSRQRASATSSMRNGRNLILKMTSQSGAFPAQK